VIVLGKVSEMATGRKSAEKEKGIPVSPCGIYSERGGADGRALGYWLQAELELKRLHERRNNTKTSVARRGADSNQSCRRSSKMRTETRKKAEAA
jgi:Protein of unknown function (DUF2934)